MAYWTSQVIVLAEHGKSLRTRTLRTRTLRTTILSSMVLRLGCQSCFMNFGLSAANIFYKPYRGIILGLAEGAEYDTRKKKYAATCKNCAFGSLSGLSSIFGLPSSLLLCGQFTTAGILNQISAVPMLSSVCCGMV